jgi:hypothetical protein
MFTRTVFFIVIIAIFVLSESLFTRYYNYINGIHDFNDGDYSAAISQFQMDEAFFELDPWKKYFNLGATYYAANLQTEARENFELARELALKLKDPRPLCMIDTDVAYSYEKSAQNQEEKVASANYGEQDKTRQANEIRLGANLYVEAYLIRDRVNSFCQNLTAKDFKENQKLLDSDKAGYERLNKQSFAIDGVTNTTSIGDNTSHATSEFEKLNKNTQTTTDLQQKETKLEKLIKESDKSEIDYQNAQTQRDAESATVTKPW